MTKTDTRQHDREEKEVQGSRNCKVKYLSFGFPVIQLEINQFHLFLSFIIFLNLLSNRIGAVWLIDSESDWCDRFDDVFIWRMGWEHTNTRDSREFSFGYQSTYVTWINKYARVCSVTVHTISIHAPATGLEHEQASDWKKNVWQRTRSRREHRIRIYVILLCVEWKHNCDIQMLVFILFAVEKCSVSES